MSKTLILGVTGHRPDKLPADRPRLVRFASAMIELHAPAKVLTGMALGWDSIIAEACRRLRVPFDAYIPGLRQDLRWSPEDSLQYHFLLNKAARVVRVTDGPCDDAAFEARNRRLVDDCTRLAAFWNGTLGGTANCVRYAVSVRRPYDNWFTDWKNFAA